MVCFALQKSFIQGSSGRSLEVGTQSETNKRVLLALRGLLRHLSYTTRAHLPKEGTRKAGPSISNNKMLHRCCRPIWSGRFFSWVSFFPGDSRFESSQLKLATPALSHTPHTCQCVTNLQQVHFSRWARDSQLKRTSWACRAVNLIHGRETTHIFLFWPTAWQPWKLVFDEYLWTLPL